MAYLDDQKIALLEELAVEFENLRDTDREDKIQEWRQKVAEEFGIYKDEALRHIRSILEERAKKIA
ncbi:hypothetical protein EDC14_1004154 [Hydrogenispora ethanolica]|uniref:Uncharacterized protein n=1 Tax=Hydrogenispora ethanolica TaxID=1082276 RepID=A0A4R1S4L9_HYDET|nr:hypothetical protein [Hydrogenispora ethanolica]TCL74216.1 hypothetical protein EDC14_1004154 [Hydrogenispora ethanolica]